MILFIALVLLPLHTPDLPTVEETLRHFTAQATLESHLDDLIM